MTGSGPLRIALSVTSGASLGAFEAGAVAGLLVALQRLNEGDVRRGAPPSVRLDAVGATSAGAMVGLLGARALLAGLDPLHVLHEAWVRRAELRRLTRGRADSPLSMTRVRADAVDLLDPRGRRGRPAHRVPEAARQRSPVAYTVALGCLQGLTYEIEGHEQDPAVAGLTHVDRVAYTLCPDDDRASWTEPERACPLDAAIASMSHPGAFRPRVLDRRRDEAAYRRAGVTNFPASGHLWYTDGSALLTRPLRATLEAVDRSGAGPAGGEGARWMHLLVHPHTGAPAPDGRWTDPDSPPTWPATVARLLTTLTTEPLYADLQEIEAVNARLRWSQQLAEALRPYLTPGATAALTDVLEAIRSERGTGADAPPPADELLQAHELLQAVVREVSGVAGKLPAATEVVSPLRLIRAEGVADGQAAVPAVLAGEFLGRFGGFTSRDLRHSDFVVGWRSLRVWLPDALARGGLPEERIREAAAAVDERDVDVGSGGFRGGNGLGDISLWTRLRLVGLVGHAARSVASDILRRRPIGC